MGPCTWLLARLKAASADRDTEGCGRNLSQSSASVMLDSDPTGLLDLLKPLSLATLPRELLCERNQSFTLYVYRYGVRSSLFCISV
jgi:hypothetical protein